MIATLCRSLSELATGGDESHRGADGLRKGVLRWLWHHHCLPEPDQHPSGEPSPFESILPAVAVMALEGGLGLAHSNRRPRRDLIFLRLEDYEGIPQRLRFSWRLRSPTGRETPSTHLECYGVGRTE